jgi:hypothetical protein
VGSLVADGLQDPAHARRYSKHAGVCLAHLLPAIAASEEPVVTLLAERMIATLEEDVDGAVIERLAGADRDSSRRAARRAALPDAQPTDSTLEGLRQRLALSHADARLGLLAWELSQAARKQAWAYRHEPSGPEHDAWLRAAAQIDGRTFEGGPAAV